MLFARCRTGYRSRMARVFHLSDVHVAVPHPGWTVRDLFSKHATGWVNWKILRRGRKFRETRPILERFAQRVNAEKPDAIIFSGDADAMGFANEATEAANLLQVGTFPGVAVPGNHDHYTPAGVRRAGFENAFVPWMQGERVDGERYPFARQIAGVWFIGVNSSLPNRGVTDARGLVGAEQLIRLDRLLSSLPPGPRVLVTHYPLVTAEGVSEPRHHGLRDREQLAEVVSRHGIKTWLCGHRHHYYRFGPTPDVPFQIICAGSATMAGEPGFEEIVIDSSGVAHCTRHSLGA